jgi:hypothetical protein
VTTQVAPIRNVAPPAVAGAGAAGWATGQASPPAVRGVRPGNATNRSAAAQCGCGVRVRSFRAENPVILLLHEMLAAASCFGAGGARLAAHRGPASINAPAMNRPR